MDIRKFQSKFSLLVLSIIVFSQPILAAENAYWWNLAEESAENPTSEVDHLVPDTPVGFFVSLEPKTGRAIECLSSFTAELRGSRFEWCLEAIGDNYEITSKELTSVTDKKRGKSRSRYAERKTGVSERTAKLIQELWVNVLLKARYDSRGPSIVLDGESFSFRARVLTSGLNMGGQVWSPTADSPPRWMVEAGYAINTFVVSKEKNEEMLAQDLTGLRSQLISYYANK